MSGPEKFTECLSLIRDQSLYPQALRIYRDLSSSEYKVCVCVWGGWGVGGTCVSYSVGDCLSICLEFLTGSS